jgi:hypothetical protein
MLRSFIATATVIAAVAGFSQIATAATQEYQFTVPVTVKIAPKTVQSSRQKDVGVTSGLPVTVSCAVGPATLALANGSAANSSGTGSATTQLKRSANTFTANVAVTVTAPDASKPANTYLCWTVVDKTVLVPTAQTPVNFISGKISSTTALNGESTTADDWNTVGQ